LTKLTSKSLLIKISKNP